MRDPLITLLAPLTRLEPPGWGALLRKGGFDDAARWTGATRRVVRGKLHGLLMELDLTDPVDRQAFFLARHFEVGVQRLMRTLLRPGDTFIDVGANVGHLTLLASACVGDAGRVVSFEPNPRAFVRLSRAIELNRLRNVDPRPVALADSAGEMTLSVVDQSFMGTLRPVEGEWTRVDERHTVRVLVGDEALPSSLPGDALIKIDVEGFETNVLRGMKGFLADRRPAVVCEVVDEFLRAAGSSADEQFAMMRDLGWRAFDVDEAGRAWMRDLVLRPIERSSDRRGENLLYIHPEDARLGELRPFTRTR